MKRSSGAYLAFFGALIGLSACAGWAAPPGPNSVRSQFVSGQRRPGFSYKTLVTLTGANGSDAVAAPIVVSGTLYGLTYSGGAYNDGVLYSLSATGQQKIIYQFGNHSIGAQPFGGIIEQNGTFYGTTTRGGRPGHGTLFSITATGKEHFVHEFGVKKNDGNYPMDTPVLRDGTFYGTTFKGGTNNLGAVFAVNASTGKEAWLYSFGASGDGAHPYAALILFDGTLYGTTSSGGAHGMGTVFTIARTGTEKVIYSFAGGADGADPRSALRAVRGELYGTTFAGGTRGKGTVYTITPAGKERVLYSFAGGLKDGAKPYAGVTALRNVLYGTTTADGAYAKGTAYSITPDGTESTIYAFGYREQGRLPYAGLTPFNTALYGATAAGGSNNTGTLFSLAP